MSERWQERLAQAMDDRGVSPRELAMRTGFSQGYISDLKYGRAGNRLSQETAQRLALALDVSLDWLRGVQPTDEQIAFMYQEGLSIRDIAGAYGLSRNKVTAALQRLGVKARTRREASITPGALVKAGFSVTPEVEREIIELYKQGMRLDQIAARTPVSLNAIQNLIRRKGLQGEIQRRARGRDLPEDKIVEMYRGGMSLQAIANQLGAEGFPGLSPAPVRKILLRRGVQMRAPAPALAREAWDTWTPYTPPGAKEARGRGKEFQENPLDVDQAQDLRVRALNGDDLAADVLADSLMDQGWQPPSQLAKDPEWVRTLAIAEGLVPLPEATNGGTFYWENVGFRQEMRDFTLYLIDCEVREGRSELEYASAYTLENMQMVRLACACARSVLNLATPTSEQPRRALEATERLMLDPSEENRQTTVDANMGIRDQGVKDAAYYAAAAAVRAVYDEFSSSGLVANLVAKSVYNAAWALVTSASASITRGREQSWRTRAAGAFGRLKMLMIREVCKIRLGMPYVPPRPIL